jgi:hypothetical protein
MDELRVFFKSFFVIFFYIYVSILHLLEVFFKVTDKLDS